MRLGERDSRSPHGCRSPPESPELGSFGGSVVPVPPTSLKPEILRLRRDGLTVREIAQRLNLRFSEVRQLLDISSEGYIEFEGFECLDFTTSDPSSKALVLDDLDELTSSDWDLSELLDIQHDFDTSFDDIVSISFDTQGGYLEHTTEISESVGGVGGVEVVVDGNHVDWILKEARDVLNRYALDKPILDELFGVRGYSCVLKSKGRKSLQILKDVVNLDEWAILDFDFIKIESHPYYWDFLRALGYSEGDLMVWFKLAKFKCSSCGANVYKAHANRRYVEPGRVHPVQLLSRCKRRAFEDYRRLLAVVHALLRRGVFNYRDGLFKRVYDKSLSLICLDLTVPVSVSLSLCDIVNQRLREAEEKYGFSLVGELRDKNVINAVYGFVFSDIVKAMRFAFAKAFAEVVKLILEKEEGLTVKDLQLGGKVCCHIWSSGWLTPHFHLHTNVLNVVRVKVNGEERFVRFKPDLPEWALSLLREKWRRYLREELFKIDGAGAWLYDIDFEEDFVIHTQFIELDLNEKGDFKNAGKILHRLRYVSRSPLLDLNIAFHEGRLIYENGEVYAVRDGQRIPIDLRWLMALAVYQNRSQCFGFVHSCKRILGVTDEELKPYRGEAERTEYCPICGHKMDFVDYITLNELLDQGLPFVISFYHNGYRRFEFWKKKGRGGGLNGGEGR